MTEPRDPTLKAVSDAVLAVAAEVSVDEVLQRLVHSARELAGARYAALGLPGENGGFRTFLTSGMSDELIASLGPLPRQHGVLGAMLDTGSPYRAHDIHEHPRFRGWWPDGHPDMRSFLGVPIVAPQGVIGAFYLTEKLGAEDFDDVDEERIGLLAAHAAIAIANARLHEETRGLSIVSERNRLALDLHDSVAQRLFGLMLTAEAARTLFDRDVESAREQVAKLPGLAQEALDELRSLVFELRPADLERTGSAARCASTSTSSAGSGSTTSSSTCRTESSPTTARPRAAPDRAGGAAERAQARARAADRRPAPGRRADRARDPGRRRRLRPERGGGPLAPARADLDGGARATRAAGSRSARPRAPARRSA